MSSEFSYWSSVDHSPPLAEAVHGSIDLQELRSLSIPDDAVVDFSSNIMPCDPSSKVIEAILATKFDSYPDRNCTQLTDLISCHYAIPTERLLMGNGCSELIHLIATSVLSPNDLAVTIGPTFSEYTRCSLIAGARVHELRRKYPFDLSDQSCEELSRSLSSIRPKLVWLCNPNNPTGQLIDVNGIHGIARRFPEAFFVLDESYIEFTEMPSVLSLPLLKNLIVLRSMTKYYAMAGLRLGFAILPEFLKNQCTARRIAWSVNSFAQRAGAAALEDREHFDGALIMLKAETNRMQQSLTVHGYSPISTQTGYFLLPVSNSHEVRTRLLQKSLLVRDCSSFGIASCIRISVRVKQDNDRLLHALRQNT